jgi:hypothetical protein
VEDSQLATSGKDSGGNPLASSGEAALERERWLRDRFEREHQITLAMMRMLLAGVRSEAPGMRFWRWLIDDLRSERRLLEAPDGEGSTDGMLLARLRLWFTRRGATGNGDSGCPESSKRGI